MKEQEIWKPIKDYEGLYEVSNLGRIKSLSRSFYSFGYGKNKKLCQKKERIRSPQINENGYCRIMLSNNGVNKTHIVHRLVLSAFVENPHNKEDVNHIDGVKTNNVLSNLEWATRSENMIHALNLGLKVEKKGDERHTSKPVELSDLSGNSLQKFGSIQSCAKFLNETHNAVEHYMQNRMPLGKNFRKKYKIKFI